MSQPPRQPYSGYPERDDQPYQGYPPASGDPYRGYPQAHEPTEQWNPQQAPSSYPRPGPAEGGYPGYGQTPPQSGYGQSPEQSQPGYPHSPAGYPPPPAAPYSGYPQSGDSGYGQSMPQQPHSGAPAHPGYGQPEQPAYQGYPQSTDSAYPGYGQSTESAYPGYSGGQSASGYGAPVAPKKSKAGKIILLVVVAVLVLCGGGIGVAVFALKDDVQDAVEATKTRVVAPETLAGRPKITDPSLQAVADDMVADMKSEITNETGAVGAFYGNPEKKDMVMIAAASGRVIDPAKEVDEGIQALGGGLKLTNVAPIDPGPLGGVAKCGDATAEDIEMGICIWADNGSVGVIGIYFKKAAAVKAEFVKIRAEVEQRS
jgi:hypothetical protein